MFPNQISYYPIFLLAIFVCADISSQNNKGCWWSFCQSPTWKRKGCQPEHLYYEVQSVPCYGGGSVYQCCPTPVSGNGGIVSTDRQSNDIDTSAEETGICSWYGLGDVAQGSLTASGERFNRYAMKAAHKTLPFGTTIRVMNLKTKKTVDVVINDRGPFMPRRILDLSYAAFGVVEDRDKGLFRCSYTILSY